MSGRFLPPNCNPFHARASGRFPRRLRRLAAKEQGREGARERTGPFEAGDCGYAENVLGIRYPARVLDVDAAAGKVSFQYYTPDAMLIERWRFALAELRFFPDRTAARFFEGVPMPSFPDFVPRKSHE